MSEQTLTARTWQGPSAPERLAILRRALDRVVGALDEPRGPATS